MKRIRLAKAILWFLIVLSTAFGVLLFLAAFVLPVQIVSKYIYAFSLPGATWIFGLTGIILLATGILLWKSRLRIQSQLGEALAHSSKDMEELVSTVREALLGDRAYLYALLSITLLATAARILFLFQPIRYDEAFTLIEFAAESFSAVISDYHVPNNHVFHTMQVYVVYHLLGEHPWMLRLPAVSAGIALVPASFLLGRILYTKQTGLLTASLVAASPLLIDYSTNARGYMLVTLFFVMTLGLSAYVRQKQNRVAWFLIPILASLGFWTIPTMLYPFGIVMLWAFLSTLAGDASSRARATIVRRLVISGLLAALLTILLYLPIFMNSGVSSVIANPFVSPLPWTDFVTQLPTLLFSTWEQWTLSLPNLLVAILLAATLISITFHRHLASHRIPVLLPVIVWCPLVLISTRAIPFTRVWLFLLPLLLMIASSGFLFLFQRVRLLERSQAFAIATLVITLLLLAILVLPHVTAVGAPGRSEEITSFLESDLEPPDRVLAFTPFDYELLYYFRQRGIPDEHLLDRGHLNGRVLILVDEEKAQTPEQVLRTTGLAGVVRLDTARVVRQFDAALLYEVDPPAEEQY